MVRSMVFALLLSVVAAGSLHAQTPPAAPAPAPAAQAAAAPNARTFTSDGGLFLIFIKPDKTADFEAVMGRLKEALQKSEKPERKEQAASWKLYKSADPGPNSLYVMVIDPAVKGADYTVANILAEAFPAEAQTLYNQYIGAFAQGQNIVNLNVVQDMSK